MVFWLAIPRKLILGAVIIIGMTWIMLFIDIRRLGILVGARITPLARVRVRVRVRVIFDTVFVKFANHVPMVRL